jgi:putative ABC transport system permease protein
LIDGQTEPRPGDVPSASYTAVTPTYLQTLKLPLLRGRFVSEQDGPSSQKVVVVSEVLANRYWPKENPLGKRIRLGRKSTESLTVVGVARQINETALISGFEDHPQPQLYVPFAQAPAAEMEIVLRSKATVAALALLLRNVIWDIDKDQPLGQIRTLDQLFSEATSGYVIFSQVMSFFALVALFLAAIGIYGVMAYSVSSRTQEFGIRMALGAGRRDVLRLVLNQGMRLVGAGMIVGIAASFAVSQTLRSLLFRITPTDPVTFGVVLLILIGAAVLAICIPGWRATRIDPNVALRYE